MDIKKILLTNTWLSSLPDQVVVELAGQARLRHLADGELLYARGDQPSCLFGVVSGRVKISNTSREGREMTAIYFEQGDWLGEISIFDGLPRLTDAVVVGPTQVIALSRSAVQALLARQPELYEPFVRILCRKLRLALEGMSDMMFLPLSHRLVKRLLSLSDVYGKDAEGGTLIDFHLPQDELGKLLGASRQSVSKELKQLEKQDWVKIAYGKIVLLDRPALEDFLRREVSV